jgi:hypothetical protein
VSAAVATASLLPELPRRRHLEADLQRSIHQYLLWALPPDAVHFAVPNGLMRSKKAAARAQGEGVAAGVPDIAIVWRQQPHPIFIELKAPKGVMSEAQRGMARKLRYCGADVLLCRSVEGVECALRELGVPLRATVAA